MKEFIIKQNDAGQRLDRFVAKCVPLLPPALLQKYIRIKRIKVCGKGAKRDTRLAVGDSVQMYINDEFFDVPSEENSYLTIVEPSIDIIYEDENILLVDKKPGVLCHSDGSWSYATLAAQIQAYLYQKREWKPREENSFSPALANRIDRNTGGIVIAAKNAEALRIMNEKIKNRELTKLYLCIVHGTPKDERATLQGHLFKDAEKNHVYVHKSPVPGAKTAITKYRTLASANNLSLLECELITGRTHQIRAQLADIGHPLLGDGKYGSERLNKPYGEKGQLLYSYSLTFNFETDAGILEYLHGKSFSVDKVGFVKKYFPKYKMPSAD